MQAWQGLPDCDPNILHQIVYPVGVAFINGCDAARHSGMAFHNLLQFEHTAHVTSDCSLHVVDHCYLLTFGWCGLRRLLLPIAISQMKYPAEKKDRNRIGYLYLMSHTTK